MQVAPTSVLRRHAEREIEDGRAAIDVIADLEAKGMTSKEAAGCGGIEVIVPSGSVYGGTVSFCIKCQDERIKALEAAGRKVLPYLIDCIHEIACGGVDHDPDETCPAENKDEPVKLLRQALRM